MSKSAAPTVSIEKARAFNAALETGEFYAPVPGASRYAVTTFGSVLSYRPDRAKRLAGSRQTKGYVQSYIRRDDGTVLRPLVHCLVMSVFEGPPPFDDHGRPYQVHHDDHDKANNALSNLKYIEPSKHASLSTQAPGGTAKMDREDVWIARCEALVGTEEEAAAWLVKNCGVTTRTALKAIRGESWRSVPRPDLSIGVYTLGQALGLFPEYAAELLSEARRRAA
jgi:hypothetical protein